MTINEFRNLLHAEPFRAFAINLADGRSIPVKHREVVLASSSGSKVIVRQPDDSSDTIDLRLVTGLTFDDAARKEEEALEEYRDDQEETRRLLSNEYKKEREKWVVRNFLYHLGMPINRDEVTESHDEPVDVTFRDARFQVKEILDSGRRRGDEYRAALDKSKNATSFSELIEPFQRPARRPVEEVANEVLCWAADKLPKKYEPEVCSQLDVIFYYNPCKVTIVGDTLASATGAAEPLKGWRSVSVSANDCAFVMYAAKGAPGFLRSSLGKVYRSDPFEFDMLSP